ncbi:MAG: hypothetical protein HHJ14_01635 [Cellulomonas sp.]|uniref:DUF5997 family protein n=1 Tax=Cellulomonas sp. TaxID=40001 RepID=UPI0017D16949|nr:DUF5997 family protein [Cellulomonas sp.]NMM15866.1 hypothetical protein [Cellulomonas sp.]NMM31670.1 hypothetical protein [Cellulomonas sp.]
MSAKKSTQTMKPATAAKKLGVYLPATPAEFQERDHTIDEVEALQENPPEWLVELRQNGPHPRPVIAVRLGVSIAGLARGGVTDPLTTEQINDLREDRPNWLVRERDIQEEVRKEEERVTARDAQRAAKPRS